MRKYDLTTIDSKGISTPRSFDFYVLLFFLISLAGWLWEVGISLITEHAWINRGVYRGPYLPIDGTGGLLIWFLLHRFHDRPFWSFVLSAGLCSMLEYAAGFWLEWQWGVRWWDYSNHFMNLNGRICLLGAVFFGLGGMLLNCFLMPAYMRLYHKIPAAWRMLLCAGCLAVFAADAAYSAAAPNIGTGITMGNNFPLTRKEVSAIIKLLLL